MMIVFSVLSVLNVNKLPEKYLLEKYLTGNYNFCVLLTIQTLQKEVSPIQATS